METGNPSQWPAIPSFEILEEIGQGAHSVVYRARRGKEELALKVQRLGTPDEAVRLRQEGLALARIRHASLAAVRDVGVFDGRVYIAMEFVKGRTLATLLAGGPLPEKTVLQIAFDMALALGGLHQKGLVHRDIKPSNIVMDLHGRARLIDLGLATAAGPETARGRFTGTWIYASPEQAGLLARPVDGRSDLYSLGAVLFELLTGRPPFPAQTISEIIEAVASGKVPEVRPLRPETSEALDSLVQVLLAKEPDDRYQSALSLSADLDRLINAPPAAFVPSRQTQRRALREGIPLIGREREASLLQGRWDSVGKAGGRGVVVLGPAGAGKSRLVEEWLSGTGEEGALLLYGKCVPADPVPLAPFRQALTDWMQRVNRLGGEAKTQAESMIRLAASNGGSLVRRLSPQFLPLFPAAGGDAPPATDQFFDVLAEFLVRLSRQAGRLAIVLEDLHWIDPASLEVLRRLLPQLPAVPVFMVATSREESSASLDCFRIPGVDHVTLTSLPEEEVQRLVAAFLGADATDPSVAAFVIQRAEGNPFVLGELLQAMMEGGALRLDAGRWSLSRENLDRLTLPSNIFDLVLSRIADLNTDTHTVLTAAAVLGVRFPVEWLPEIARLTSAQVNAALEESRRARLLFRDGMAGWAFVHDRVREALLQRIPPPVKRLYHQRAAAAISRGGMDGTDVYALAEHHYLGEESPDIVLASNRDAAETALRDFAHERAVVFFQRAREAMRQGGVAADPAFERGQGECLAALGRVEEAEAAFRSALARGGGNLDRAQIHLGLAKIALGRLDTQACWKEGDHGLQALNLSPIRSSVWGRLASLSRGFLHLFRRKTAVNREEEARRNRVRIGLLETIGMARYFDLDPLTLGFCIWEIWTSVARRGLSSDLSRIYAAAGAFLAAFLGWRPLTHWLQHRAQRMAQKLHDPLTEARARFFETIAFHFLGETLSAEQTARRALVDHGAFLDNSDYLSLCADSSWNLIMRGYAAEAWEWIGLGLARAERAGPGSPLAQGHTYRCYAGPALAMIGRPAEGASHLSQFEIQIRPDRADRWRRSQLLAHRILFSLEQGEIGNDFEGMVNDFLSMARRPRRMPHQLKHAYVAIGYARARQAEEADAFGKARASRALARALKDLGDAGIHPTLQAHRRIVEAKARRLEGKPKKARRALSCALALAVRTDNPWVHFEVMVETARLLAKENERAIAQREAHRAHRLASEMGWIRRARKVREEFQLDEQSSRASHVTSSISEAPETFFLRRHLDALLDINKASAGRLDPVEQARVVLDEIVRILGAERAFLFLTPDNGDNLFFRAGRDRTRDLPDDGSFSRTAVEAVRARRKAIVLNEGESASADVGESVQAQSLRSLIAAPIVFHERLIGVIYADSHLARGLFTKEDLTILNALSGHIAVALETAHALRLEVELRAEQAQSRLADAVRKVGAELNSTLELPEVLSRLLGHVSRFVLFDRAVVLLKDHDSLKVVAHRGFDPQELPSEQIALASYAYLSATVRGRERMLFVRKDAGQGTHYLGLSPIPSWILVPLETRGEVTGLLALDRVQGDPFTDRDADMAATFAGPAAAAIQNARLFAEVQRQAVTDGLTGLLNRRHFMHLAEQEIRRGLRFKRPFSVLMMDIDHFKSINDRWGHATGDRALIRVAEQMRACVRGVDILARYGGEEFVAFLPETAPEAGAILAERIRATIERTPLTTDSGEISLTVSVGLSGGKGSTALNGLIQEADAALYRAKQAGRNRVHIWSPPPPKA